MGLAGAAFWGFIGFVLLIAAGYSAAHGSGSCVEGNELLWLGIAAIAFAFAFLSLTFLAIPITVIALVIGLILLAAAGVALLAAGSGCHLDLFGWNLPFG